MVGCPHAPCGCGVGGGVGGVVPGRRSKKKKREREREREREQKEKDTRSKLEGGGHRIQMNKQVLNRGVNTRADNYFGRNECYFKGNDLCQLAPFSSFELSFKGVRCLHFDIMGNIFSSPERPRKSF